MLKRVHLFVLICLLLGMPTLSYAATHHLEPSAEQFGMFLTPTLTPSATATEGPSQTPTSTGSTPCPVPTQEPLWVDPVISPTHITTQIIYVFAGNNAEK